MEEGAEGLEKIVTTDHTQQLPPGTAIGMAIGAEIPPAHPAAIGTVRVRAEMVPGVHLALTATGGGDPWRWRSRGSDQGAGGACSHATHWGLWVRPANDFGSLERGRR